MCSARKYLTGITPVECFNNNLTPESAQFQDIVKLIEFYLDKQQNINTHLYQYDEQQKKPMNYEYNLLTRRKKAQRVFDGDCDEDNESADLSVIRRKSYEMKHQDQFRRSRKKSSFIDEPISYYNPDGPKLPSIYRKKLSNKY